MLCIQTFKSWFMCPKADSKNRQQQQGNYPPLLFCAHICFLLPSLLHLLYFLHPPACLCLRLSFYLNLSLHPCRSIIRWFPTCGILSAPHRWLQKEIEPSWPKKNWRRISGADEEIEEESKQEKEGDKKAEVEDKRNRQSWFTQVSNLRTYVQTLLISSFDIGAGCSKLTKKPTFALIRMSYSALKEKMWVKCAALVCSVKWTRDH